MNLLLLKTKDLIQDNLAIIEDYRLQHLLHVHQAKIGDTLRLGLLNGNLGSGQIISLHEKQAKILFQLEESSPPKLPVTLLLALPRPKMLKRILQTTASMGVSKLILINSYRVEKSFWQTPLLTPEYIEQQLILGLEQACDTVLPEVILEKRFKPFVEDHLPSLLQNSQGFIAHPGKYPSCSHASDKPTTLAIGPEGGWIAYEVEKLQEAGLSPIQLGNRILRVETAVVALLTKLFY